MIEHTRHDGGMRARERGVVLFIALIALVAMSLAGIALMRSVGAGILLAGNLDFKRTATTLADLGIESGRKWFQDEVALMSAPATVGVAVLGLDADRPADGYYASWTTFDPASASWTDANSKVLKPAETPSLAREVRYVIHRLCPIAGPAAATDCVTARSLTGPSTTIGSDYSIRPLSTPGKIYYRVTARVLASKGTVSFVQTVMF